MWHVSGRGASIDEQILSRWPGLKIQQRSGLFSTTVQKVFSPQFRSAAKHKPFLYSLKINRVKGSCSLTNGIGHLLSGFLRRTVVSRLSACSTFAATMVGHSLSQIDVNTVTTRRTWSRPRHPSTTHAPLTAEHKPTFIGENFRTIRLWSVFMSRRRKDSQNGVLSPRTSILVHVMFLKSSVQIFTFIKSGSPVFTCIKWQPF